jgi:acetyl esterase/lipase
MRRQDFLRTLAGGAIAAVSSRRALSQTPTSQTETYKTVDGLDIKADVYGAGTGAKRPAVVWIHGGALIMGSRRGVPRPLRERLLGYGYAIVSIDYRLAPETKLPGIIDDVRDAFRWVREQGSRRFGIDPDRIATAGGSAGGYLTLMSGFAVTPRPRALASFWGYGDLTTPWYAEPDAFYRKQPLVSKEEADRAVGATPLADPPDKNQRGRFYLYCRQQGIWPNRVAGHDARKESKWFDPYCPIRNVNAQYPPAILIHGTADTDVPYDESRNMAARLKQAGVEHEFLTIQGAGHGLSGAAPEEVDKAYGRAAEFLRAHLAS